MIWEEVLSLGSWDNIVTRMVEENCYEFGMRSLGERIKMLKEKYGLDEFADSETGQQLQRGEMIRHLIVHNGRKVSQEYLNHIHEPNAKLGEAVSITGDYLEQIGLKSRIFIRSVFVSVAMKFFKKSKSEFSDILPFTQVLRMSQPTNE